MPAIVASDLDRTLIYSAGALMLDGTDAEAPLLTVAEVYNGAPLSYLTRDAEDGLERLAERGVFVPVTTRTVAQYRRVRLPRARHDWAVTTNGGVILHRGEPDADWTATVAARLEHACAPLAEIEALVPRPGDHPAFLRLNHAEELFVYAIVDRANLPADELSALTDACEARGWTVSLQGRKLYLVPSPLTKSAAIAEIAARTGADRVVAAGDSLLDLDLLRYADAAIRPAHGELHDAGITLPHLEVTAARGVMAGQEIVERLVAAVDAPVVAAPVAP